MGDIDGLFERYIEAAGRRQAAVDAFLQHAQTYRADVKRDGREITTELLEGFFEEKYAKNAKVRKAAQDTKNLLANFDQAAALVTSSVMTMTLQLKLALDTLALETIAAPVRELEKPLNPSGKTALEIAREGVQSLSTARRKLHGSAIQAVTDAHVLENQVEETLRQATLLLEVRRKRLWDFRRENLSVTWGELRQRAAKEGQDELSETFRERLAEIITEALEREAEDISQLKRASRYIRLFYRLFGTRLVNRQNNDTDQMMGLFEQLELENKLLKEFDDVFERAGASIGSIRAGAENGFEGRAIS
jgi:hypothetical protein